MKIGDLVKSEKWHVEGVIQDVQPCRILDCDKIELTVDKEGSSVRNYYHEDYFVVVEEGCDK